MKKILSIFILVLSVFLLASCELNSFFTTKGKITTKTTTTKSNTSSSEVTNSSSQTTKSISKSTKSTTEVIIPESDKFTGKEVDTVKIMSINDTHGQLEEGSGYYMSLATVDGAVNYLESQINQKYIKIMAGDLFQGSFVSRFTYGRCMIEAINAMDFDVMVLGNHEFDWGLDVVEQYFDGDESNGEANFPLLCANLVDKTTGERPEWVKPYTIINYYNVKVGIIGCIGEDEESDIAASSLGDYEFIEELPIVKECSSTLHSLGCDVVIYACHDYDYDRDTSDGDDSGLKYKNITDELTSTEYIDAYVAGHSHHSIEQYFRREDGYLIPLVQNYTKNGNFGTISLNLTNKKSTSGTINHYNKNSDCVKNSTPTSDVEAIVSRYQSIIDEGNVFVYHLNKSINNNKQAIGDYMMDAMISYINNNVNLTGVAGVYAFLNNGGIRVSSQAAGDLTFADIYEWFPFDNKVSYVKMTGAQLVNYVNSYSSSNTFTSTYSEFAIDDNKTYILATSDYCRKYLTRFGTVVDIDIIMYNMLRDYFLSLSNN